jgi:hypothetical protein
MRMPVDLRYALSMTGLGIAFIALGRALIWIPQLILNGRALLCLILGVVPIAILSARNRRKYLSSVLTIAGSAGLLQMIAGYLSCVALVSRCSSNETPGRMITASACYIVFLIGGLWLLRKLTARHPHADRSG